MRLPDPWSGLVPRYWLVHRRMSLSLMVASGNVSGFCLTHIGGRYLGLVVSHTP